MTVNSPLVPADVLEKVARLLGAQELHPIAEKQWRLVWDEFHNKFFLSDGDLLLAILNKAAEMGKGVTLTDYGFTNHNHWDCTIGDAVATADMPLDAALLAFAQLERAHD